MSAPVASAQRYTRAHPCPICGGWNTQRRGRAQRCWGYLLADGTAAVCMRVHSDRELEGGWLHRLPDTGANGRAPESAVLRRRRFDIRDPNTGRVVARHMRNDLTNNDKRIWWEGGLGGRSVTSLPLYMANRVKHEVPKGTAIVLCEGEPACDALWTIGQPAVGTVTGAGATPDQAGHCPDAAVFADVADYVLVPWPDNDQQGEWHMAVASQRIGPGTRVIQWAEAPEHGDAADFVKGGGTLDQVRQLLDDATCNGPEHVLERRDESAEPAPSDESAWRPTRLLTESERAAAVTDTWLDAYVKYCGRRTDAPAAFHEALGLVLLSAMVGRRGLLHLSHGDLCPSIWLLIVADSTIYRKSTALDLARELLSQVSEELLAPNDFTPQRFVAILAEHDGQALVFARDEFSGFLDGLNRLDFMAGLKEQLCDIYDGRRFRREKMIRAGQAEQWKYDIKAPFLSIMAGTTLERFVDVARVEDVHSGFLPRWIFVTADGPPGEHREIGEFTEAMRLEQLALVDYLKAIQRTPIHLRVDRVVFDRFNAYTRDLEAEARAAPHSNLIGIVGARLSWTAFRAAVLLAVAEGTADDDGVTHVSLPHLFRGIDLAETWRHGAIELLSSLAPSKFERYASRLVALVRAHPNLTRRSAMRSLRVSKKLMTDLEETVEERGEVIVRRFPIAGGLQRAIYALPSSTQQGVTA